ncbi:HD domain-containing phosphohydrolase [Bacteroidota bacterium]
MTTIFSETGATGEALKIGETTAEVYEYKQRLELLYDVAQQASSFSEVSMLLENILQVTQKLIRAEASSLLLVDQDKMELFFHAAGGKVAKKLKNMRIGLDSGIAGWVAHHGVPLVSNDVATDELFSGHVDQVTGFVTKSIIAVPVVRGQNVIGIIELLNKSDGSEFTEGDLAISTGFATTEAMILLFSMAATAINNIKLHQAAQDGLKSTVETLVAATDAKDPYAYGHSRRVKEYVLLAAKTLSFSDEDLRLIEFGALLHDIGKIGIYDSIMRKSGSLTDEDWYIMRKHPLRGANIVGEIPFLAEAREIVLYHHEKFDGTGYPEGLKGENIPFGARLVAVADAFDAMTSERSYRKALSTDYALGELGKNSGTQFCPVAVEAFVSGYMNCQEKLPKTAAEQAAKETAARAAEEAEQLAKQEAEQAAEEKAEREAEEAVNDSDSEIYEGNVRLLIISSAGYKQIMQFKRQLDKVESLRILLIGGSGDEGNHIVVSLQKPVKIIGALSKMSIVDKVDKKGEDIVVTLRGSARTQLSRKQFL